jgi:ectoine hydroxylase-related dioxygenase (phytanoyl-CoA dioxygenase family)
MNKFNKQDFFKNGFYVIKNLLEKNEIDKYLDSIKKKRDSLLKQNAAVIDENGIFRIKTSDTQKFKNYSEYDDENLWDYVSNKKLTNNISDLLNEKSYFVHDLGLLDPGTNPNNDVSWHRDCPCRTMGVGPDWDPNMKYNVVTAITYLQSSEDCGTGLNIIPGSHKLSYKKTISNILRFIHLKTRNNNKLKIIRNLISKIIGTTINYEAGDCIVFLCTLYHAPITINNSKLSIKRQCITARYGGIGKHSNTYIDYVTNKRPDMNKYINAKKKNDFLNYIKEKRIFLPFIENTNNLEGAFLKQNR